MSELDHAVPSGVSEPAGRHHHVPQPDAGTTSLHIVDIQLGRLRALLAERQLAWNSPRGQAFLAENGFDPVYGARPFKRAIQR